MPKNHDFDLDHFRIPPGKKVRLKDHDPGYTGGIEDKNAARQALIEDVSELAAAQDLLWASGQSSVLIIFQALDAAGKDGTIKHVMSGVNPQGVDVYSFKAPSSEELAHHYLWRPSRHLPARGRIAIFNRSYYEEVLVVRVHPELLAGQWLPSAQRDKEPAKIWPMRYEEINAFERVAVQNGICVIKFFLHVSRQEQRQRFLERLTDPRKYWKFAPADFRERARWDDYMEAFEDMLGATSTADAPWYVVPADRKWFMRAVVADIIAARIRALDLEYPKVSKDQLKELEAVRRELETDEKA